MRTALSVFVTGFLFATTASAQNRAEFNSLSAWELTQGVQVETTCEVEWIDEVTEEVYCFSREEAKAQFVGDIEGNIAKAMAAYEKLLGNTDAASSPPPDAPLPLLPLQANTLYVNDFFRNSNQSSLFTINHANAAKTRVGPMGRVVTDVAFKGSILFGVTFNHFLTVNFTTGESTVKNRHGFHDIDALAVSPSGTIFAAGSSDGKFISINSTTGRGTLLGDYGLSGGREIISSGDLAFKDGVLFATVRLKGLPANSNDFLATIKLTPPNRGKATLKSNITIMKRIR